MNNSLPCLLNRTHIVHSTHTSNRQPILAPLRVAVLKLWRRACPLRQRQLVLLPPFRAQQLQKPQAVEPRQLHTTAIGNHLPRSRGLALGDLNLDALHKRAAAGHQNHAVLGLPHAPAFDQLTNANLLSPVQPTNINKPLYAPERDRFQLSRKRVEMTLLWEAFCQRGLAALEPESDRVARFLALLPAAGRLAAAGATTAAYAHFLLLCADVVANVVQTQGVGLVDVGGVLVCDGAFGGCGGGGRDVG